LHNNKPVDIGFKLSGYLGKELLLRLIHRNLVRR